MEIIPNLLSGVTVEQDRSNFGRSIQGSLRRRLLWRARCEYFVAASIAFPGGTFEREVQTCKVTILVGGHELETPASRSPGLFGWMDRTGGTLTRRDSRLRIACLQDREHPSPQGSCSQSRLRQLTIVGWQAMQCEASPGSGTAADGKAGLQGHSPASFGGIFVRLCVSLDL